MIRNPIRARRRTLLTGATAAAALGATAACGDDGPAGTADDPITISFEWWGDAARAELYEEALALFQDKNEGLKVKTNFADFPVYWEGMTTRMASQDLPDVFQMDYSRLRQFASSGLLLPLEGVVDTSDYREGYLDTCYVDDELVAVPAAGNTLGLVYRADLFEEHGIPAPAPGDTWDDYHAAIVELTEKLGEDKWGGGDYAGQYHFMELWLRQNGGTFYNEEGTALAFDQAMLVDWWSRNQGLNESGAMAPIDVTIEWGEESGLVRDQLASEIGWDNFMSWHAPAVEELGGTLAVAAPPSDDPENLGLYLKPSMQLVISGTSEYSEEGAKLVEFLQNDPEANAILGTNRGIPATNVGLESVELDEVSQAVLDYETSVEQYLTTPPSAPPAATGAIEVKFSEIYEQVLYGEMTPDEGAGQFFTEAETLFASEQ